MRTWLFHHNYLLLYKLLASHSGNGIPFQRQVVVRWRMDTITFTSLSKTFLSQISIILTPAMVVTQVWWSLMKLQMCWLETRNFGQSSLSQTTEQAHVWSQSAQTVEERSLESSALMRVLPSVHPWGVYEVNASVPTNVGPSWNHLWVKNIGRHQFRDIFFGVKSKTTEQASKFIRITNFIYNNNPF